METRLVPEAGFPLELIRVGQLKNVGLATRARTLFDLPLGVMRCVELLRSFKPNVVVGVGGYASGPAMMAAILLRVPTLAFEPNAVPGLANRLVGKWVNAAAVNFAETCRYFRNAHVTGIPLRSEFFAVEPRPTNLEQPLHLLVFGGSQGARIFNEVLPRIASQLLERVPGLTILHQAGARFGKTTEEAYRANVADSSRWQVAEFLDDMPRRFAEADLILCRSGASTVAELAAAGRASLLVPFPGAADDHQLRNAEVFVAAGAAELRVQGSDELMTGFLLEDLSGLLRDSARRSEMGRKVKRLAHPNAVREIGQMIVELARRG